MKVNLNNVRIAFASLFEPKTMPGQQNATPKFACLPILDPAKHGAEIAALNAAMQEVGKAKWGAKAPAIVAEMKKTDRLAYRDHAKTNDSGDVYDGFEGMHYVSASSAKRPVVIDRDKQPLTQADGKPYSGCYANVIIEVWAQDNQFGKRINAELKGVQFVKDGDAFGGGAPVSADEFADLGVPEEATELV